MQLILFTKPGCHLCEALAEKLRQIEGVELEMRDITTRDDWFQRYEYEVPVVLMEPSSVPLPRFSPRSSVPQIAQLLTKYCADRAEKS